MSLVLRGLATTFVDAAPLATPTAAGQGASGREWPVGAAVREFVPPGTYNWRGAATHALLTSAWYPVNLGTSTSEHNIGPPDHRYFALENGRTTRIQWPTVSSDRGCHMGPAA